MGAEESNNKYGGMVVHLDSPFCISGSQVTGKICIKINQPFPAQKLKLKVEGKESCVWYVGRKSGGKSQKSAFRHDHNEIIFDHEEIIFDFSKQSIKTGDYEFPFSFYLPKECPSSAYFGEYRKASGVIEYRISGILNSINENDVQSIQYCKRFIVRQNKFDTNFNMQSSSEKDVNLWCCCCSRGVTKVSAIFEKNSYSTSEVARAIINVDNTSSKLNIDHISMKLKQHVRLNTNGHHYHNSYTICKQQYPGLEAGKSWENMPLEINLANSKQTFHDETLEETKNIASEELKMWEFIQPTTNGKWVNIQYEIEIIMKMGGTCCSWSGHPTCYISIFLQPPLVSDFNLIKAPLDWNPTLYKEKAFDIPNTVYFSSNSNENQEPNKLEHKQKNDENSDSDEPVSFYF